MKNWFLNNWFKVIAIGILVGALGSEPYIYYQILRWVVCIAAIYTVYLYYEAKYIVLALFFVAVAVLFNPIAPIYMSRSTWQIFDLLSAVIFFASLFFVIKSKPHG